MLHEEEPSIPPIKPTSKSVPPAPPSMFKPRVQPMLHEEEPTASQTKFKPRALAEEPTKSKSKSSMVPTKPAKANPAQSKTSTLLEEEPSVVPPSTPSKAKPTNTKNSVSPVDVSTLENASVSVKAAVDIVASETPNPLLRPKSYVDDVQVKKDTNVEPEEQSLSFGGYREKTRADFDDEPISVSSRHSHAKVEAENDDDDDLDFGDSAAEPNFDDFEAEAHTVMPAASSERPTVTARPTVPVSTLQSSFQATALAKGVATARVSAREESEPGFDDVVELPDAAVQMPDEVADEVAGKVSSRVRKAKGASSSAVSSSKSRRSQDERGGEQERSRESRSKRSAGK